MTDQRTCPKCKNKSVRFDPQFKQDRCITPKCFWHTSDTTISKSFTDNCFDNPFLTLGSLILKATRDDNVRRAFALATWKLKQQGVKDFSSPKAKAQRNKLAQGTLGHSYGSTFTAKPKAAPEEKQLKFELSMKPRRDSMQPPLPNQHTAQEG